MSVPASLTLPTTLSSICDKAEICQCQRVSFEYHRPVLQRLQGSFGTDTHHMLLPAQVCQKQKTNAPFFCMPLFSVAEITGLFWHRYTPSAICFYQLRSATKKRGMQKNGALFLHTCAVRFHQLRSIQQQHAFHDVHANLSG